MKGHCVHTFVKEDISKLEADLIVDVFGVALLSISIEMKVSFVYQTHAPNRTFGT